MRPITWFRGALTAGAATAVLAVASPAAAQTGTVTGLVTEAGTGRALEGVQVFLVGRAEGPVADRSSRGVLTDSDGRYTLAGIAVGQVTVRARLVGFTSQTASLSVTAGGSTEVNFELRASVIALDEIVVTGAGVAQSKKQLGNTIATVQAAEVVETAPVKDVSELLAAREPGVTLNVGNGLAGGSSRIEIRGTSSLSQGGSPVVYVDGVRIDNGRSLYGANTYDGAEDPRARVFDNINPEAVERVEILKGAAAASLYGSEANAGVIQIFTKKGQAGRPRFNFRIDQGFEHVDEGRLKPQAGFARTQEQADNVSAIYGLNVGLYEPFEVTNLADMYGNGYNYAYSTNVTGGSDDFQYFVAGRWTFDDGPVGGSKLLGGTGHILDDKGPALNDQIRRLQGSAQFTIFPRDRLSFRISTQFTDVKQQSADTGNNIYAPLTLAAFSKPELAECFDSPSTPSTGQGNGTCSGPGNPTGQAAFMTLREATRHGVQGNMEHFNASMTTTYQAASSLNLDVTFGIDATNQANQDFWPFGYAVDGFTGALTDGYKSAGRRNNREITFDGRGTWTERFGNISSQFVAGMQGFISRNKTVFGDGDTFPGPGLEVVGAAANKNVSEGFTETVNVGMLFQEQLGFNDWFFLTGGGRWDRNSAFGDSTSGQFYPKISASIIPSDMLNWESSLISSLRLRGAYGKSGQQPGAFDRFTTFSSLAYETGPGLRPDNIGNTDLRPEVSRELEIGGEVGLFDNRYAIDVTYWNRQTKDALVSRNYAPTGGFINAQLTNLGLLASKGLELKFDALLFDKENFSMNFFANGAYIHEEIRDMGGAPQIKSGGSYSRYRNFIQGPDTVASCDYVQSGATCRDNVVYYEPGYQGGYRLIPTCDQNMVYHVGPRAGQARTCYTPGSTVPYDTNGDGMPDDRGTFEAWLAANTAGLTLADIEPFFLVDDEDDDGDLQDNYLGKSMPDWAGAFGAQFTLWQNLQINTLFEYRVGNFRMNNLTDAFRQANPLIGRNILKSAEVESTIENPSASASDKADAALIWAEQLMALRPYSGMNTIKNANFLRFRELGFTYTAPASLADKFGMTNLAFSLSARNLALWTAYDGVDPELNGRTGELSGTNFQRGLETFNAAIPRRFTFSVRFSF